MARASIVDRLTARTPYIVYRAGAGLASALPGPVVRSLARVAGRTSALTHGDQRRLVARHLQRVSGRELRGLALRAAVNEVYESYARYWAESFRLHLQTPESLQASMTSEGMEHLHAAYDEGRGVILAMPHLGGWDFGGAWLALQGLRPAAVAEVLEPPELFEWFVRWRRELGIEIIPADARAGTAIIEALRDGRTVGLISDRDILGSGVDVEFFGETTTLPAGPATLALRTGAPLLAGAVYFTGHGGHHAVVRPRLDLERRGRFREDVTRLTQDVARELEALIRRGPTQWHLMQPNWPSDPGHRGSGR